MGLAPRTLIIVAVGVALGVLFLLVILYRIAITPCLRSRASPLPPIQPLSHERAHQRAQFEASRASNPAFLTPLHPPPLGSPSPGDSKTSLLGSFNRASYITATVDGAEELSHSSPLDVSRTPASSSSVNLSSSPSPRRQSSRPGRDDRQTRRPSSLSRAVPHARHSQVQIVLPAPLGTGLLPNSRQRSMYELDVARDRMSIVDQWVPAGRDSVETSAPRPRRAASNPNTNSVIGGYQADDRSMPTPSFTMAGYGEREGSNAGAGTKADEAGRVLNSVEILSYPV